MLIKRSQDCNILMTYFLYRFCLLQGCSTDKYYGEGYCHPCPPNCHDRRCEKVDGTCSSCIAGYAGSMCNEGNKHNDVNVLKLFNFKQFPLELWYFVNRQ